MKQIKLSGREMAALRAINTNGSTGAEIVERTQLDPGELTDILNGLADIGYVEAYAPGAHTPYIDAVPSPELLRTRYEINPSYALDLKKAMARS
jgi:hypothetical protein